MMDVAQSVKDSDTKWKNELTDFSESVFKTLELVQKIDNDRQAESAELADP